MEGGSASDSLDPRTYADSIPISYGWQIWNGLVEIDANGDAGGELAENFEAKPGATTWIFNIRKGVTFTSGKTLDADDVIYSLRFAYAPEGRDGGEVAAQRISSDLAGASSTRARNVDYWYCGHPALQPVAVSDDGVHTRLRFAENAEWPAIFVRTEDGAETLLNFSVDQGDVVIHRIAHRFILRRGKLTGCIVNAGFAGAGDRLESGTVSPAVRRETQGGRP